MQPEIWKPIPGHEGRYEASDQGRIRSVPRKVRGRHRNGTEFLRTFPGRILKPGRYEASGHVSVVLGRGTNGRPVHQLVMRTFVGPPPEGMEVCHNDGDPTNNALANLRYDTRRNNILDSYRHGTGRSNLTPADVRTIRARLAAGERGSVLAREYGTNQTTISRIKLGKAFAWLK